MNDTVIFLVLAGLALLFKWLTKQASGDGEKPEPPQPNDRTQPGRPPPQSDEERIRRFLEALGAPPGTQPPPPVRPRRVTTPPPRTPPPKARRSWVQPLPPLVTTPEDVAPPLPPLTTTPPEPIIIEAAAPPVVVAPPAPPPVPSLRPLVPLAKATSPRTVPLTSLGTMLRTRGNIRRAIILREVLGPPRGLQALDDFRSF